MTAFQRMIVLLVCVPSLAGAAPPQIAERRLAFAEDLYQSGEKAFALLEYRRFLFHHGDHPQAVHAAMTAARLYVAYVHDVEAAKRTLTAFAAGRPRTPGALRAKQFAEFLEANSDYERKPLVLFVSGADAEQRGQFAEAAVFYGDLHAKYPKARLADAALLQRAKLLVEQLRRPQDAATACRALLRGYPGSTHAPDAAYTYAVALEKQHGAAPATLQAYRDVTVTYPRTESARRAADRLEQLRKDRFALRRRYEKASVRAYKVLHEGYLGGYQQYVVRLTVPKDLSERSLKATLEDALLAHYQKRKRPDHPVLVEAYTSYPDAREGSARWTQGQAPQYTVKKRAGKDVLKDVLIDILRKKI